MNIRPKLCAILLLSFLMNLSGYSGPMTFERPQTKEDLIEWIAGTEWKSREMHGGKRVSVIRRFYPNGVIKAQIGVARWTEGVPVIDIKYKVLTHKTFEYGSLRWSVILDENFERYTGTSNKREDKSRGALLGRFDLK